MSEQETESTEAPRHHPAHSEEFELPLQLGDGRAGTCYSMSVAMAKEAASLATLQHVICCKSEAMQALQSIPIT